MVQRESIETYKSESGAVYIQKTSGKEEYWTRKGEPLKDAVLVSLTVARKYAKSKIDSQKYLQSLKQLPTNEKLNGSKAVIIYITPEGKLGVSKPLRDPPLLRDLEGTVGDPLEFALAELRERKEKKS